MGGGAVGAAVDVLAADGGHSACPTQATVLTLRDVTFRSFDRSHGLYVSEETDRGAVSVAGSRVWGKVRAAADDLAQWHAAQHPDLLRSLMSRAAKLTGSGSLTPSSQEQ
eukprot:gene18974-22679_t